MIDLLVDHYLNDHHITFEIDFVPVSNCPPGLQDRINWRVILIRNLSKQSFCFWQSLTKLKRVHSESESDQADLITLASEYELQVLTFGHNGIHAVKRLKKPRALDIVKQLFNNAYVLDGKLDWTTENMDLQVKGQYLTDIMNALKIRTIFSIEEQQELNDIIL